jgi:hypothetical protein
VQQSITPDTLVSGGLAVEDGVQANGNDACTPYSLVRQA